ncbi:MAG TPA: 23S rRNA (adenine(2503)-C(2))-methyltransferase RlmN [bacterium]|nr:23S rRNA (adenine(2503)-C(2))-methyltransferase RlmN [bacterium]HPN45277.1 23S rRNA (adenine(2503)-C(2))-methyltransferase RlmN [bacterium]
MSFTNLTGLTLEELEAFAESAGEKKYRGRQLFSWIYEKKARSFDAMTNIAKTFRQRLQEMAVLGHVELQQKKTSAATATAKYLFRLMDGHHIESVFIPDEDRRTLCISSQVGCALNCAFCATAKIGFKRNLTVGEIVDQVLFVERDLGIKLTNIVFMGMGEPFNNYDNVIKAAQLINHSDGIAVGARHIVISTAGVVDNIYRFTDEQHKFKLAISLNSPFQEQRLGMMPVAKKWHLQDLFKAITYYAAGAKQLVTFEYVLFAGLNDSQKHAHELRKLLGKIPCKLNIIPYNTCIAGFNRPDADKVDQFVKWLLPLASGPVSVRWSKGDDIDAACGQLAGQVPADNQITGRE